MSDLPSRIATLEERDVHFAEAIVRMERTQSQTNGRLDKVVEGLEQDRKGNKTAFYALVGSILTPFITGAFGAAYLLLIK